MTGAYGGTRGGRAGRSQGCRAWVSAASWREGGGSARTLNLFPKENVALSCFTPGGRCAWRSTAALPHRGPHLWLLLLASQRPQAIRSGSTSARHLASKRSTGRSFGKVSVCVYVVCAFMWCACARVVRGAEDKAGVGIARLTLQPYPPNPHTHNNQPSTHTAWSPSAAWAWRP